MFDAGHSIDGLEKLLHVLTRPAAMNVLHCLASWDWSGQSFGDMIRPGRVTSLRITPQTAVNPPTEKLGLGARSALIQIKGVLVPTAILELFDWPCVPQMGRSSRLVLELMKWREPNADIRDVDPVGA